MSSRPSLTTTFTFQVEHHSCGLPLPIRRHPCTVHPIYPLELLPFPSADDRTGNLLNPSRLPARITCIIVIAVTPLHVSDQTVPAYPSTHLDISVHSVSVTNNTHARQSFTSP
jgi:hypothetical protein